MLGQVITEIQAILPDEYRRLAINGRGTGVYYSYEHRHALFTRHGVVFEMVANVAPDEAQAGWLLRAEALDRPKTLVPREREDWQTRLMEDALTPDAQILYNALEMVRSASHSETGTILASIRPAKLKEAIEMAMVAHSECREDLREALRAARPRTPEEAAEEPQPRPVECHTSFFLKGVCTGCGLTMDEHGKTKQ